MTFVSALGVAESRSAGSLVRDAPAESAFSTMSAEFTSLVLQLRTDPSAVVDRIVPQVYGELRRIAHRYLRGEQTGHTLSTTALVHEAYLRLVDADRVAWEDQTHFLALAANTMRRVLIDQARSRRADKRGGGHVRVDLDAASFSADESADILVGIDDALDRLGKLSPRLVKVVECRFFGGMTEEETASALGVTDRTVRRDWLKAKGLLASMLEDPSL